MVDDDYRFNQFERDYQYSPDSRPRRSGSQSSTESRGSQCSYTAKDEFDDLLQNINDQITKHMNLLHDYTFTRFLTKSRAARHKIDKKLSAELERMLGAVTKIKGFDNGDFADRRNKQDRKKWTAGYKECRGASYYTHPKIFTFGGIGWPNDTLTVQTLAFLSCKASVLLS